MQNPASQLTRAKDVLVECGVLLGELEGDTSRQQDILDLDSLILDLTLPKDADEGTQKAMRRLRAAIQTALAQAKSSYEKAHAARDGLCQALMLVMEAGEMCDPMIALPAKTKMLESDCERRE